MRYARLLVVAAVAVPVLALAQGAKTFWVRQPTAQDVERSFPAKAKAAAQPGVAVIICKVLVGGHLSECVIKQETPAGQGFGDAALKLAPLFQAGGPAAETGAAGITIPIAYTIPGKPLPTPTSPGKPVVVSEPTAADIARVYPPGARRAGRDGAVKLTCQVQADGAMASCKVAAEEPTGLGFADAALQLRPLLKLAPQSTTGVSVAGAAIDFPVVFKAPAAQPQMPDTKPATKPVAPKPAAQAPGLRGKVK